MSLARRLVKLETVVTAKAEDTRPPFWAAARIEEWQRWVVRFLETMPHERAQAVYDALTTLPEDRRGALANHIAAMATHATMGAWDAYIEQGRPLALPEAVCAILEAHPDAIVRSAYDCEDCGFETPIRSASDTIRHRDAIRAAGREYQPSDRAFLTECPLCGGAVKWQGFNSRRWGELWRRQKVEIAAS